MRFQIIIPARKGSKRLPDKNIRSLNGVPLIEYSIKAALDVLDKDSVWVNSDCEIVEAITSKNRVQFYHRPEKLGDDHASTVDVILDHISFFEKNNINCDAIILLQPTSPFRSKKLLQRCIESFTKSERNSLATFSVVKKKLGTINSKQYYLPINYEKGQRSQELADDIVFENGNIYIVKKESLKTCSQIITEDVFPYIISNSFYSLDIDTLEDFELAEFYQKNINENRI